MVEKIPLDDLTGGEGGHTDNAARFLLTADYFPDTLANIRNIYPAVGFPAQVFFRQLFFRHLPAFPAHVGEHHIVAVFHIFRVGKGLSGAYTLYVIPEVGITDGPFRLDNGIIVV